VKILKRSSSFRVAERSRVGSNLSDNNVRNPTQCLRLDGLVGLIDLYGQHQFLWSRSIEARSSFVVIEMLDGPIRSSEIFMVMMMLAYAHKPPMVHFRIFVRSRSTPPPSRPIRPYMGSGCGPCGQEADAARSFLTAKFQKGLVVLWSELFVRNSAHCLISDRPVGLLKIKVLA